MNLAAFFLFKLALGGMLRLGLTIWYDPCHPDGLILDASHVVAILSECTFVVESYWS